MVVLTEILNEMKWDRWYFCIYMFNIYYVNWHKLKCKIEHKKNVQYCSVYLWFTRSTQYCSLGLHSPTWRPATLPPVHFRDFPPGGTGLPVPLPSSEISPLCCPLPSAWLLWGQFTAWAPQPCANCLPFPWHPPFKIVCSRQWGSMWYRDLWPSFNVKKDLFKRKHLQTYLRTALDLSAGNKRNWWKCKSFSPCPNPN